MPLMNGILALRVGQSICFEGYGHFTTGGIDDRIDSTLPPVFRPNTVPRS
jgi:hypothetical protein